MTKKTTKLQDLEKKLAYTPRPAWAQWDDRQRDAALRFAGGYMAFLDRARTERLCVQQAVKLARKAGFADFAAGGGRGAGHRFYFVQKRRALALLVTGTRPLTDGISVLAAHIDSPRLDLKARPLFEDSGVVALRTHYYGGLKKYQWMNVPLALHGVAIRADGSRATIAIGDEPGDPLFTIPDLEPHLAYKRQNEKKLREAVTGEELLILAGALPVADADVKQKLKLGVLQQLQQRYGLTEEDLIGADLCAVPAAKTADVGFDRALIGGYGHDDRSCAYAALQALFSLKRPAHTALVVLFDKEETGSEGDTGAKSRLLEDIVTELLKRQGSTDLAADLVQVWRASRALSGDVAGAPVPAYKDVYESSNAPLAGYGVVLAKFTGSGGKSGSAEASAEYMGEITRLLRAQGIPWQAGEHGKIDEGGGGTIAKFLGAYGMDVLDAGPAILGMHSPWEIVHKADLYATYLLMAAFLKQSW